MELTVVEHAKLGVRPSWFGSYNRRVTQSLSAEQQSVNRRVTIEPRETDLLMNQIVPTNGSSRWTRSTDHTGPSPIVRKLDSSPRNRGNPKGPVAPATGQAVR